MQNAVRCVYDEKDEVRTSDDEMVVVVLLRIAGKWGDGLGGYKREGAETWVRGLEGIQFQHLHMLHLCPKCFVCY